MCVYVCVCVCVCLCVCVCVCTAATTATAAGTLLHNAGPEPLTPLADALSPLLDPLAPLLDPQSSARRIILDTLMHLESWRVLYKHHKHERLCLEISWNIPFTEWKVIATRLENGLLKRCSRE